MYSVVTGMITLDHIAVPNLKFGEHITCTYICNSYREEKRGKQQPVTDNHVEERYASNVLSWPPCVHICALSFLQQ